MAKLFFRFGTMNSGKSLALLSVAYNYEENGSKVLVIKPAIDKKASNFVSSRAGLERQVDYLLNADENICDLVSSRTDFSKISCILVDESQFLQPIQVDQLYELVCNYNIPVICYGLKIDFERKGFPGSDRLLILTDVLEELVTICGDKGCPHKAHDNARMIKGEYVSSGEQVVIDNSEKVKYVPLCKNHYNEHVLGYQKVKKM